jgi:hypothetical protein
MVAGWLPCCGLMRQACVRAKLERPPSATAAFRIAPDFPVECGFSAPLAHLLVPSFVAALVVTLLAALLRPLVAA